MIAIVKPDSKALRASRFAAILAEDRHDKPWAYDDAMRQMFAGVAVSGASVLDIGSGRGLTSLWLALQGAERVVSMEPECAGSRSGVVQLQRERVARLGLQQVEIVTSDFQHYQPENRFDLIVSNASINHLQESQSNALHDQKTFDSFVRIAAQIRQWLHPGGKAVITDACRYNLWTQARRFGLPKRWCYSRLRTIDWKLHQQPSVWERVFLAAGFSSCQVRYPVPYRLRKLAPVMDSAAACWLLQGEFILTATK